MNSFISRPMVITQTVGERLKKVRQGSGFSIDEVARRTGIARRYLACIEGGEYGELPGEIYRLEFIKTYARFLRIDEGTVAASYCAERQRMESAPSPRQQRIAFPNFWLRFLSSFTRGRALAFFALACFVLFAALGFRTATAGPRLEVFSPVPYHRAYDSSVALSGAADPGSVVTVNNQRIPLGAEGVFHAEFNAPPGLTLLTISALNERGRSSTEYRTVVVDRGEVAGASTHNNQFPILNNQ